MLNANAESALSRNVPEKDGNRFLQFHLVRTDGGEYAPAYPISNILRNDKSVYCSMKARNVNILLKYQPDAHCTDAAFVLTSFLVKAPYSGFTSPCKEGLLFVSNEPITFESTAKYDNFTLAKYRELEQRARAGDVARDSSIPAAFFRLSSSAEYSCSETLKIPTSGKYILIKLIRGESREGRRGPGNIDLQFIGFRGLIGKSSAPFGNLN